MFGLHLNSIREQLSLKSEHEVTSKKYVNLYRSLFASELALTSRPAAADEDSDAESGTDDESDEADGEEEED